MDRNVDSVRVVICTRCPSCESDLCFPQPERICFHDYFLQCPLCQEAVNTVAPTNVLHLTFRDRMLNEAYNRPTSVVVSSASSILDNQEQTTLRELLDDPNNRPRSLREARLDLYMQRTGAVFYVMFLVSAVSALIALMPWWFSWRVALSMAGLAAVVLGVGCAANALMNRYVYDQLQSQTTVIVFDKRNRRILTMPVHTFGNLDEIVK